MSPAIPNNIKVKNTKRIGVNKVSIIGVGPGTVDYLLPIARKEVEKADCLIGASRILALFQYTSKKKILMEGHFKEAVSYIKKNKDRERIAVLVSGDPGFFSFLGLVEQALEKKDYVVIPGISTLQLAFARIGESWQDAKIISIHGKNLNNLEKAVRASGKVFLLTDLKFSPQNVAAYLLKRGIKNRKAVVFENLAYPNERIVETDLENISKVGGFGLCVMLIKK